MNLNVKIFSTLLLASIFWSYVSSEATTIVTPDTYIAFLKSASSPGRTIILQMNPDDEKTVTFTQDYQNDKEPIVKKGGWEKGNDGTVIVTFPDETMKFVFVAVTNEFKYKEKTIRSIGEYKLVLKDYDTAVWGSEGLILKVSPLPFETEWSWIETTLPDDEKHSPGSTDFVLRLGADERISVQGDCNVLIGSFRIRDEGRVTVSLLASTKKFCPNSKEQTFIDDIHHATRYSIKGDILTLTLDDKLSGTMSFTRRIKVDEPPYIPEH